MSTNKNLWEILDELKKHRWVDLTHEFGSDTPRWEGFEPEKIETLFTIGESGIFVNQFTFPGQYGTHLDAPGHFVEGKRLLDKIELEELVLPLVVIDVSKKAKENPDYEYAVEDILDWEKEYGQVPEGSFVALRSDWSQYWPDQNKFQNFDENGLPHFPGYSLDTLKFLYEERKVKATGHEPLCTEVPYKAKEAGSYFGELYILGRDTYQIEELANLDQVPPTGSIIISLTPKAKNAPGFPVRSFAIVPD